jgi:hypothetical protein
MGDDHDTNSHVLKILVTDEVVMHRIGEMKLFIDLE